MYSYIKNSFGDEYLHEVNGNSLNKLGALKTISNRLDAGLLVEEYTLVVIGTDSGLIPHYLIQQGVPTGSEYLFIESDELYPTIQSVFPSHPQLHLCRQSDWTTVADQLNLSLYIQANSARQIDSIALGVGFHAPYIELAANVKREFNFYVNSALKNAEYYEFFKMGLANLADNQYSITSIIDDHERDTAIILGAGPSLDQHIEWIREHQQYLYIFTVSRLAKKLSASGITPDYIVTVDSHDYSYEVGKDSFLFEQSSTLVHSFHANTQLLGQWLGNKVFTGKRYPWETRSNNDCIDQSGTTVTNIAYDAAITIGFKQILLAGVDFCHDTSGFTHAADTGNAAMRTPLINSASDFYVTNNRGEQAETRAEFKEAGSDFSLRAQAAAEDGVETFNLSGSAMQMEGVTYREKEQIVMRQTAEKAPQPFVEPSPVFYKQSLSELNKARSELKKLTTFSKEAIQKNRILFNKHGEKDFKTEKQLIKVENKLENDKNPFIPLIKVIGLRQNLKYLRATRSEDHEWTHEEITDSKVAYYREFQKNANRLIQIIENSIKRVKSRQMELQPAEKAVIPLLTQWQKDKQPRRVQQLSASGLLDAPAAEVETLIESLGQLQQEIDSQSAIPDDMPQVKIRGSFSSINSLTSKHNLEGLKQLHEKLQLQQDAPNKHAFITLCSGMIAYLEERKIAAFNLLTELLGEDEKIHFDDSQIEYILAKVSMIALEIKDYPNAIAALETLSHSFSSYYTPKYAELLYLTGNVDQALNTYESYISQYPDDLDTIFGLAELQRKENLLEPARALYQFILSRNPDYQPAIQRMATL